MDSFKGFPPRPELQGYTAVPNVFFDEIMPQINNMSELKILLAVFRKTYGWVKEIDQKTGQPIYKLEDAISYTQFEELTGLSSTSIATGLSRAINHKYIEKTGQGNFNGLSNSYRVKTNGAVPKNDTPVKPVQKEKPKYIDLGNDNDTPNIGRADLRGVSLSSFIEEKEYDNPLSGEKQDILNDIFGTGKTEEPKKKQKSPHSQFIAEWYRCYLSKLQVTYGNITGKEHGHIKGLLKEYDLPVLIKAMEFYFMNYQSIKGVPSEYPTITIFYAWRKKIIPASIHGLTESKDRNAREFDDKKWQEGDDFFDN